jgi:hypothetical protein
MMRFLLLLIPLSVFFSPIGSAETQNDSLIIQVCSVSAIPYGYVIVGKTNTEQCRANAELPERDNTLMIKKPDARETICEKSPYPSNYAVIARTRLNTCPSSSVETDNNAWIIGRMK